MGAAPERRRTGADRWRLDDPAHHGGGGPAVVSAQRRNGRHRPAKYLAPLRGPGRSQPDHRNAEAYRASYGRCSGPANADRHGALRREVALMYFDSSSKVRAPAISTVARAIGVDIDSG